MRIDSVLDAMPEAEDWVALDAEITSKKKKLADCRSRAGHSCEIFQTFSIHLTKVWGVHCGWKTPNFPNL